MHVESLYRLAS